MIGHQQRVTVSAEPNCIIVSVQVRQLDYPTMAQIERRISGGHSSGRGKRIVLDLCRVDSIPSVMMGALIDMLNNLHGQGHRLVLAGLSDKVRGSFTVTRLDVLFDICNTVDDARAL